MIFLDTETAGLAGIITLIQHAEDNGEIELYDPWNHKISETMEHIEWLFSKDICAFNWTFDQFHLTKIYNVWRYTREKYGDIVPFGYSELIAENCESQAREDSLCLKPPGIIDLFLHARKGPYQSMMERRNIKIKRIPRVLGNALAKKMNELLPIADIYFARQKQVKRWHVTDIEDEDGIIDPGFVDVCLKFMPSSALKAIIKDAFGVDTHTFAEEGLAEVKSLGYAPFALAGHDTAGKGKFFTPRKLTLPSGKTHWQWGETWPAHLSRHVAHWRTKGKQYASDDIKYTRMLYHHFNEPPVNDHDSTLACQVGNVRWVGFKVDIPKLKTLVTKLKSADKVPVSPNEALIYLKRDMPEIMSHLIKNTNKNTLASLAVQDSDVGKRARQIIQARQDEYEVALYEKLIRAGRFHASFKVIGALSGRMAGGDQLNPQGISRKDYVRELFDIRVSESHESWGGDFDAFEISIMDAVYSDPRMHAELSGDKKIHGLWGSRYFFPNLSYDEILASKGKDLDYYVLSKNGVFAICYFGEGFTLITRVGVNPEVADEAYRRIMKDYPEFKRKRDVIIGRFSTMRQEDGIGSKITWNKPEEFIESFFGFRRYFTLENKVVKTLFDLSQNMPDDWKQFDMIIERTEGREQKAFGAVMSALYGAAFGLQGSVTRAAGNHVIQATGSQVTKHVQVAIWDFQPIGVHPFMVAPLNVHDEIDSSVHPSIRLEVRDAVHAVVESYRKDIPLIGFKFCQLKNWSEKK